MEKTGRSDAGTGEVLIDAPPEVPRATPVPVVTRVLPVVLVVAMVGMMVVYFRSGVATGRGPAVMFFPVMMAMSVLATLAYSLRGNGGSAELERDRREYLRYLDGLDVLAAETACAQWQMLHDTFPEPAVLWMLVDSDRRWERDTGHRHFLEVRIGMGTRPLQTRLVAPESTGGAERDPVTVEALEALLRARSTVDDVPVTVRLGGHYRLTGPDEQVGGLVRAVLCQLATWHSPRDVKIAAALHADDRWDWLKWLPHHTNAPYDGAAHLVIVADSPVSDTLPDGATVLGLGSDATDASATRIDVEHDEVRIATVSARPDTMTTEQALACARRLARYRAEAASARRSDWANLLGVDDISHLDIERVWQNLDPRQRLRVPIGISDHEVRVDLDLNEAARGGSGPHGLCIGATGSGKSEFLRTLVLGLITTHSPDALNLVLVDFKGGATFLGLASAPHISALITNLSDEAAMVARMADALAGEMTRRQELLRAANVGSAAEYTRTDGRPPLPTLLVVVDEFSELLHQQPDFADLFVAIGRLGRSLGIHLLLASQRLDEGRLRGLESHLSYRICLKTFSAAESRAVLGVADAHDLPNTPGAAYLKTPSGEITRFQTAFVSGRYDVAPVDRPDHRVRPFTARPPADQLCRSSTQTTLEATVARLLGHGTPAHRVWLSPLPRAIPLSDVLMADPEPLTAAIGLVDRPFEQRRDRLLVDLSGAAGNVVIVGGPQSGKSTAARTLMVALSATHDPADVQMYGLDLGGGALCALTALPHVGAVAGRRDTDLARRIVTQLHDVIRARERTFEVLGVDSMADYRARRAAGECRDDPYGDVFLVVDGWSTLRTEFESLESTITTLAGQGLSYGVHVVVTAARWAELRPALKDQLGTRIELRLGDPAESEMDRRRARHISPLPGRGLTRDGHELLIALPRLDGTADERGLAAALTRVGEVLHTQHTGAHAPRVRLLPRHVAGDDLVGLGGDRPATQVVLGIGDAELAPVAVDFAEQSDLVILGDAGCGKSTTLRALCDRLVRTNDPSAVQLLVVDYRREMLDAVGSGHLRGYAVSAGALETAVADLIRTLRERMPGPDITPRQLRERTWWTGPELYVVVDDYDLVAAGAGNPLTSLLDFVPHARDLGLHLVIARRSGGAARAMFDPVLSRLKELGCMGLMMSASPDEGVLLGPVRPRPLPPGRGTLLTRAGPEQLIQVALPCDVS
ncbi:type VII secretion protein EccCb [Mycolicibacterium smegmatis]|uniref:type VII secretion protein EccCb n=1 Tax=Mycolicibacterium smegmatis TaxID=1772 RepID=UPI0005D74B6D|nr:type VII secretion protein EccCb [Mycolicibacterium smegmatis]MDF1899400.1 type VII secretion protein EccCb [Mycolicibacterium smegmatis]MDF1905698.1 type VII secretion protein EccCb [Mycolicibacterium smegmatis]MDF1918134.1 type VII secretion protein EccCb [Mycolicibacterium smegmatis]MDF1924311.1 type VII secretion protein EccCb [Mycolicibacterium smegmatis]UAK53746.1 type VII secretion protein EccCb [Mycolicibacterium smegmatis]